MIKWKMNVRVNGIDDVNEWMKTKNWIKMNQ